MSIYVIDGASGTLVLKLPGRIIDSKMPDNSADAPLTAFFRQDATISATVYELGKTEGTRIVSIDFAVLKSDPTYNMGIQGTYVMPEFGSFPVVIELYQ